MSRLFLRWKNRHREYYIRFLWVKLIWQCCSERRGELVPKVFYFVSDSFSKNLVPKNCLQNKFCLSNKIVHLYIVVIFLALFWKINFMMNSIWQECYISIFYTSFYILNISGILSILQKSLQTEHKTLSCQFLIIYADFDCKIIQILNTSLFIR